MSLTPVLQALLAMQRHSWEQGVASHALLDLGRDDLAVPMALDAVTRELHEKEIIALFRARKSEAAAATRPHPSTHLVQGDKKSPE